MTPIAIAFLVLAVLIIWGGLVASIVFLGKRSEVDRYPEGGQDVFGDRLDD